MFDMTFKSFKNVLKKLIDSWIEATEQTLRHKILSDHSDFSDKALELNFLKG